MSPLYEYWCQGCGLEFDKIRAIEERNLTSCPDCGARADLVPSVVSIRVVRRERQLLGSGAKGRYVSHKETGGLPILIPSFGALEQEEIDYIAEGAIEKEKERVRKRKPSRMAQKIAAFTDLAYQTKPGQRLKAIKEASKQKERHI